MVRPQFFLAIFLLLAPFLPLATSYGEDPRGRLPDGRAYRTDGEGNKLVDYIAELEMTIDSLNRRVIGLETEIDEKQAKLDRVSQGGAAKSQFSEKTLAGSSSSGSQTNPVLCPEVRCPPAVDCSQEVARVETVLRDESGVASRALVEERSRCSQNIARLNGTVATLQNDLASKSSQLRSIQSSLSQTASDKQHTTDVLSVKNAEVKELKTKLQGATHEATSLESEIASKRDNMNILRQEMDSLDTQISQIGQTVASLREKRTLLDTQRAALEKVVSQGEVHRAALEERPSEVPAESLVLERSSYRDVKPQSAPPVAVFPDRRNPTEEARGSLSISRLRAMDSLKGSVSTSLNQIQSLIVTRDRMYQDFSGGSQNIGFRPSAAVSSRGLGLQAMRERLNAATTTREFSELNRAISEIRSRIEGDIALMKRVKRLG